MHRNHSLKAVRILALALALLIGFYTFPNSRAANHPVPAYLPLVVNAGSPTPAPTPTPPPAPGGEVIARGFTGYYDLGDHISYGEVVNNLDVPIYDVELILTYRNASGAIVGTDEAAALLERIEPRSSAPVSNIYFNAPSGITRIEATITGWSRSSLVNYQPVTIVRMEQSIGGGSGGPVLEGEGRNDTGQPMSRIFLVASFRNAAGEVVGIVFDYPVIGSLQPGQTFEYTIETFDSTLANTKGLVQGRGTIER